MKQFGLSAPVYATEPVFRLGLLTMYDHYLSRKQVSEFDLFTLDDIDSAFQNVTRLTYSQNCHLSGKGEGIVIAPHVAGHLLGGTVWKITKDGEEQENIKKEEFVSELPVGTNWNFDVHWYSKIPGIISASSFDGKVGIYNIEACARYGTGENYYGQAPLKAPKWYQRKAGVSFGFGGKLVSFHTIGSSGPSEMTKKHGDS